MVKKLTDIKKTIDKNQKKLMCSVYMVFDDNSVESIVDVTTGRISNIDFVYKKDILKLYMEKIVDGTFEIDDLAWLNFLFNAINTLNGDKSKEKELNNLWCAINFLILTKNKHLIDFVSLKLEEISLQENKVKEYAL